MYDTSRRKQISRITQREEWKLQALETGGVDNWEWYDESLFHPDEGKTLNDIENMYDREIIEKFRNA